MKETSSSPELSVIVPVLNEAGTLPLLFDTLAEQEGIRLELVICDGGSSDGTAETACRLGNRTGFPVRVISGERGRGRQLNAGALASSADTLLFLHADTRFAASGALRAALDSLNGTMAARGSERIAGHFPLRFDRNTPLPSLAFYYYECKARLDRRDCTHGDQGFMLRRAFFKETGPFDESFAMLAETRFAEVVRKKGEWLLFPDDIFTSARRFESEGLYARQALNAIIMNFAASGRESLIRDLPTIYSINGQYRPWSMFLEIGGLIADIPWHQRLSLWHATGVYVSSHAWQIPFFLDTRRNFRRGHPAGRGEHHLLDFHDRFLSRLTGSLPCRLAAAVLAWAWFRLSCLHTCSGARH